MKYILMNIPMSKATHEGRKTNTRRPIKGVDGYEFESMAVNLRSGDKHAVFSNDGHIKQIKPKYQVGETIWVREPVKITNIIKMEISFILPFKSFIKLKIVYHN